MISRRQCLTTLGAGAAAALSLARARAATSRVQVGVCAAPGDLAKAESYGFDYLEPPAAALAAMSAADFQAFRARVLASRLRCTSLNSFVRKLRVVGEGVRTEDVQEYLNVCLPRCQEVGGEIVVWGSAGSRNVPEGFPRERAWEQIKTFLRAAGDAAHPRRLVIAIEPLRRQESNIINTAAEALRLVREVHHPNVRMIVDYYHLRAENEDPEIIWTARREIVHFHFANPQGRRWPKSASEDPEYARFFELVRKIHFRGGISIEGNGSFELDARASLEFFHQELA
ncbi:MAG TPA: sugar phosphate isomerase/epimerase family protein [Terriglobia bacterium]|jgi:sugar phosphate isomerase/epimerase|nr:sugar phosphate isomerase/epimerase family protein [Terriglobia bacterium]